MPILEDIKIMSKGIVAIYQDDLGVPVSGLSPIIKIWDITVPSTVGIAVASGNMSEIGEGAYIYDFTNYSGTLSYLIRCDGGAAMDGLDRYVWSTNEIDPATVADQVWSEERINHTSSGTFGEGYSETEGWSISGK